MQRLTVYGLAPKQKIQGSVSLESFDVPVLVRAESILTILLAVRGELCNSCRYQL